MTLTTLSSSTTDVSDEALETLRTTLRGPVLQEGDPGYEEARVVQNGMIDKKPGLIVRCSGAADVTDALEFAAEHHLLTAVRSGGHSVAGHCTCDGGVMIDLSQMRGVWVDPERRTVRVEGGATWGDVDRETQAFGLAVPGGIVSTTGVAGLTLGGGIGWLHRKYGLACDSLRSADIVTPDGQRLTASASENQDLFWALRGGGGNFGIVTSFEFETHPLGPIVMCGAAIYPAEVAEKAFPRWRDWTVQVPDEVTTRALFWWLPEAEALPPEVHDQEVFIVGAVYAGPADEGESILQPMREFAEPLADLSGALPYRMFQASFDPLFPKGGLHSYWKSTYLEGLSDEVMEFILDIGRNRPTPQTIVHVPLMGGATSRIEPTATAFGDRSAPYMLSVDGNWSDPAHREKVIPWVRDAIDRAERLAGVQGSYLNFSSDAAPEVVQAAFGENMERLGVLKGRYDEENLLRLNSNVAPA